MKRTLAAIVACLLAANVKVYVLVNYPPYQISHTKRKIDGQLTMDDLNRPDISVLKDLPPPSLAVSLFRRQSKAVWFEKW